MADYSFFSSNGRESYSKSVMTVGGLQITRTSSSAPFMSDWSSVSITAAPLVTPPIINDPIVAGIDTSGITDTTTGKTIPISLGGVRWMGGYRIYGPVFSRKTVGADSIVVASGGWSFGYSGDVDGVRDFLSLKLDGVVYFDAETGLSQIPAVSYRFYPGDEEQEPDPILIAAAGAANASAFRGHICLWVEELDLTPFGNLWPFPALKIADAAISGIAKTDFDMPTSSSSRSIAAIDWQNGVMYSHGADTSYRLLAHRLSDGALFYDIPISNLMTDYESLAEVPFTWVAELQLIVGVSDELNFVLLDPQSGSILVEGPAIASSPSDSDALAAMTYAVDTTTGNDVYIFAICGASTGKLRVHSYDPLEGEITIEGVSDFDLDGEADSGVQLVESIVAGTKGEDGSVVFYVSGGTKLVRCTVNHLAGTIVFDTVATLGDDIRLLHFDPIDSTIVCFLGDDTAVKLRESDFSEVWNEDVGFSIPFPLSLPNVYTQTDQWRKTRQTFGYLTTAGVQYVDLTDGSVTVETLALTRGHVMYDAATNRVYATDNADPRWYGFAATSGDRVPLSYCLEKLGAFPPDDIPLPIETDGIDNEVDAVIFTESFAWQQLIQNWRTVWRFDCNESQDGIKLLRRELGTGMTIDAALVRTDLLKLGAGPSVTVSRAELATSTKKFSGGFIDKERDYTNNSVTSQREEQDDGQTANIDLAVVMTADEMMALLTAASYRDDAGRETLAAGVRQPYLELEPSDIITVYDADLDFTFTHQIESVTDGANFAKTFTSRSVLKQDDGLGGVFGTVPGYSPPVAPAIAKNPASTGIMLDTPLLARADESTDLRTYFAVTSQGQNNWPGGQMQVNAFAGSYGLWGAIGSQATESQYGIAHVAPDLPPTPLTMTDYTTELRVTPVTGNWGTFQTITYAELMDGRNLLAWGKPGRWEIIAAGTVTIGTDNVVVLTELLRGLYGSEVWADAHLPGDQVIVLDSLISRTTFAQSLLDAVASYRAVGFGQNAERVTPTRFTVTGTANTPPAPSHLTAISDGSDIDISWDVRSRFPWHTGGTWDTEDSETEDEWVVRIYDGATLKRTFTVSTPSKTYLNADIVTDFGSLAAAIATGNVTATRVGHQGTFSVGEGFAAESAITS